MTDHTDRSDQPDLATVDYNAFQGVDTRFCPNCGGNFAFNPTTQHLECRSCGAAEQITHAPESAVGRTGFTPKGRLTEVPNYDEAHGQIGGFGFAMSVNGVSLNGLGAMADAIRDRRKPQSGTAGDFVQPQGLVDTTAGATAPPSEAADHHTMTHLPGEQEIICQSCGGRTTFVGSLTSTKCPYCASGLQLSDVHEAPDRLSVDGVLPFKLTEAQAKENLDKWISSRWFAPNEFKKYSNAGSFASMYAAYFTYDAATTTDYKGERGRTRTTTVNGKSRTTTDWTRVSGRVYDSFEDVAVLANTGLNRKFVKALEPWPMNQLQPYSADYLAGHLARTYDHDADHCFDEAEAEMERSIERTIRDDIGGDKQRIHRKSVYFSNTAYKHVLLPIWLLTVVYGGQTWQVFMNGDTGEVHGERPYSKAKIAAAATLVAIVVLTIVALWATNRST